MTHFFNHISLLWATLIFLLNYTTTFYIMYVTYLQYFSTRCLFHSYLLLLFLSFFLSLSSLIPHSHHPSVNHAFPTSSILSSLISHSTNSLSHSLTHPPLSTALSPSTSLTHKLSPSPIYKHTLTQSIILPSLSSVVSFFIFLTYFLHHSYTYIHISSIFFFFSIKGGALATLMSVHLSVNNVRNIKHFSFGSPRVFNRDAAVYVSGVIIAARTTHYRYGQPDILLHIAFFIYYFLEISSVFWSTMLHWSSFVFVYFCCLFFILFSSLNTLDSVEICLFYFIAIMNVVIFYLSTSKWPHIFFCLIPNIRSILIIFCYYFLIFSSVYVHSTHKKFPYFQFLNECHCLLFYYFSIIF